MSILENGTVVTWPRDSKMGFLHSKKIEKDFDDFEKELHIKLGSAKDLIGSLSGGNQQKVVLAKWLDANPKVGDEMNEQAIMRLATGGQV